MAKNWEVFNIDDDNLPEIAFTTDDTNSEKFILRNILLGVYGVPYFEQGTVENGLSSRLVMKFKPNDNSNMELSNLGISANWKSKDYTKSTIRTNIENIDDDLGRDDVEILSARMNLQLQIIGYDSIKNDNPVIIVERYRKTKKDRLKRKHPNGNPLNIETRLKGGFVKPLNRISEIPVTSEILNNVNFSQETYFRPAGEGNDMAIVKRGFSQNNKVEFRFRIKTDKGISPQLLRIGLRSFRHETNNNGNILINFTPQELASVKENKFFCLISYAIL